MAEAVISPKVLAWARSRVQMDYDTLAEKVNVKPEKVSKWEHGEASPTFRQAQKIADVLRIPFPYLFLAQPPEESVPNVADFRTIGDRQLTDLSVDFREILDEIVYKHEWYRDYLIEQGASPLPFVGQYSETSPPKKIVACIRRILGESLSDRSRGSYDAFQRGLIDKLEDCGVWVMCKGIVGQNTRRPLNNEEFRGLALADRIVPLIFINGKDPKPAQTFTLMHELVHICIGKSGVSGNTLLLRRANRIEKLCNRIAGELLVPTEDLSCHWNHDQGTAENTSQLRTVFRVSEMVIGRRAADAGFITWREYETLYRMLLKRWRNSKERSADGGDYYATEVVYNGRRFMADVIRNARSGELLYREAGRLLGVNPSKVDSFAPRLEGK